MKNATFVNFSTTDFTGEWNGEKTTFRPGSRTVMEDALARHYAKHLVNRELIASGVAGAETHTSPKNPEQVEPFRLMFEKAYIADPSVKGAVEAEIERKNADEPEQPSSNVRPKMPKPNAAA